MIEDCTIYLCMKFGAELRENKFYRLEIHWWELREVKIHKRSENIYCSSYLSDR